MVVLLLFTPICSKLPSISFSMYHCNKTLLYPHRQREGRHHTVNELVLAKTLSTNYLISLQRNLPHISFKCISVMCICFLRRVIQDLCTLGLVCFLQGWGGIVFAPFFDRLKYFSHFFKEVIMYAESNQNTKDHWSKTLVLISFELFASWYWWHIGGARTDSYREHDKRTWSCFTQILVNSAV